MFSNSSSIFFLQLIPILSFVFLLLALALVTIPLVFAQRNFFTRSTGNRERRRHLRFVPNSNTYAEVNMGGTIFTAQVSDISQNGISLKHLPKMYSYDLNDLSVIIKECGMDYKLLLNTKWVKFTESGKKIGAKIDIPSSVWTDFLLQTKKL